MTLDKVRPALVQPLGKVRGPDVVSDDPRWAKALRVVAWLLVPLGIAVAWLADRAGLLVIVVAALCAGCGPGPEARTSSPPASEPAPLVCVWGRDSECCIRPPRFEVATLRDLRAERFGRVRLAAAGGR